MCDLIIPNSDFQTRGVLSFRFAANNMALEPRGGVLEQLRYDHDDRLPGLIGAKARTARDE